MKKRKTRKKERRKVKMKTGALMGSKTKVEKKVEEEENKEEEEEGSKDEDKGTNKQQSVQDIQLPPPSPPHSTITPTEIIKIKDVTNTTSQNINPLTTEDLTKILDQTNLQAQLCANPILFNVEELQKLVDKIKEGEVPPQEPPQNTQTTGLSFLPPPSPPRIAMQAHQEPSATIGKVTDTLVQTVSTLPVAEVTQEDMTQEEEK